MLEWRHYLHTIPELAFKEYKTSKFIYEILLSFGLKVYRIGETGIVGVLQNSSKISDRPSIAIRADLDALPILEKKNHIYKSKHGNCMHACGHDGHMAIVLGVAKYFSKNKNFDGTIYFIFSPAEEEGGGCRKMLEDDNFKSFNIKEIYGIHNWPGLKLGKIGISTGVIMGGDDNYIIKITGKGGHGALPENTINPIFYINKVLKKIKLIEKKYNVIISITSIETKDSFNVIPDSIILKGTFRYFDNKIRNKVNNLIKKLTINDVLINIDIIDGYPPTINNNICARYCKSIVDKMDNVSYEEVSFKEKLKPSRATEDFSFFLEKIQGCYVWLGAMDEQHLESLHNNFYDFNDKILPIGFNYFKNIILGKLKKKKEILNITKIKFKPNPIFLGFIQLATDFTLDMEIGPILEQVPGVQWRLKKLPVLQDTNISIKMYEDLKVNIIKTANNFTPKLNHKNEYGSIKIMSLACTSMSFVIGPKNIQEEIKKGYNCKINDMATSIINAVKLFSKFLKKPIKSLNISVLTPYNNNIHQKNMEFLKKNNFNIVNNYNLNINNDSIISSIEIDSIENIITEMGTDNIDIFIIGCNALNITKKGVIDRFEKKFNTFFITSNQALLWNSLHLGLEEKDKYKAKNIDGYGYLFKL